MPIILFFLCILFQINLYAENALTCPSIESVHHLNSIWPNGRWLPLYIDNGELASLEDISNFSKNSIAFIKAEWSGTYLEAGHCYYAGSERIILAMDMLKPNTCQFPRWHYVSDKLLRCDSMNENDCEFSGTG